ncbi:MAG: DUF2911 domain-containing protein [bacterium]|nr:DUF2911 domain-containing protein [bacterium]
MARKILIGVGILIMLIGAIMIYLNYRNRSLSPPGSAELTNGDLTMSITYSRPSVRDRLIFGSAEDGALQPYGVYWRLGANESTEMTINTNVTFNGQDLAAGTYKLYAVPGPESFKIGVNSELGEWGYFEPNYDLDLFTTEVPVTKGANVEQHTISLLTGGDNTINIVVEFSDVRLSIPVQAK